MDVRMPLDLELDTQTSVLFTLGATRNLPIEDRLKRMSMPMKLSIYMGLMMNIQV